MQFTPKPLPDYHRFNKGGYLHMPLFQIVTAEKPVQGFGAIHTKKNSPPYFKGSAKKTKIVIDYHAE